MLRYCIDAWFNIQYSIKYQYRFAVQYQYQYGLIDIEYGYHPCTGFVRHSRLPSQQYLTRPARRQLFSPEYSHRSPGSYERTHPGLGRLSDTPRAPDPRPEIIYTSPQSDFLSSGYEIITMCGRKSSKGLYERLACSPVLPYRGVIDATVSGVRDTT